MRQETRELTNRERDELQGVVAWSTQFGRAVLFGLAVFFVGSILRAVSVLVSTNILVWLVPTGIFGYLLYRRAGNWTGGSAFRRLVRQDIEQGEVRMTVIWPVDVTEIEELEDEGPSYIVKTDEDDWVLLSGQEMVPYKLRGFPWSRFSVDEAPFSGTMFGLTRVGDPIPVNRTLPPLPYELARRLGTASKTYTVLDEANVALLDDVFAAGRKRPPK